MRQTDIVEVDPDVPDIAVLQRAAQILQAGGLVAFPTETVYGLGANALDEVAVAGIFAAKGRPSINPLIVHVPDAAGAQAVAGIWSPIAARLAERFWPGPLTLVVPKRPDIPDIVTAGGLNVGLRVPAHRIAQALLRAAGLPVAAPSANRSSQISPTRAEHVAMGLSGRIDMILDGGATSGGLESTVLDLSTPIPTLLRPGLIAPGEIEALIGPIQRHSERTDSDQDAPLPSPGLLARHYAPRAPLEPGAAGRVAALRCQGERVGWLTFDVEAVADPDTVVVTMPAAPAAYAARLYAELHALDAAGVTRIVVEPPPETEAWLAIRDRLRRAGTL